MQVWRVSLHLDLSHAIIIWLFNLQILLILTLGGTKEYKVLMDQFHHVAGAFLELEKGLVLIYAICTSVLFCFIVFLVVSFHMYWLSYWICRHSNLLSDNTNICYFITYTFVYEGIKRLSRKLLKEWVQEWPSLSARRSVIQNILCSVELFLSYGDKLVWARPRSLFHLELWNYQNLSACFVKIRKDLCTDPVFPIVHR